MQYDKTVGHFPFLGVQAKSTDKIRDLAAGNPTPRRLSAFAQFADDRKSAQTFFEACPLRALAARRRANHAALRDLLPVDKGNGGPVAATVQ